MANLCQILWTVVLTVSIGRIPAMEEDNFILTAPENDQFPSTNFVPLKLRMSDAVYDRLLGHLSDQLSAEDVDIPIKDFFPKGIESDEEDELELVHEYDLDDDDDDDDVNEFMGNLPNDASVSTDFGKREFKFSKVLEINKNGTKTFYKFRQSTKYGGHATTSATGNYNTSLTVATSATGTFSSNSTYFKKGQHRTIAVKGTAVTSSSSKSTVERRRLFQDGSADSSTTLQIPTLLNVNNSIRSGSETLKIPFKSFLTLFKAEINTTAGNILDLKTIIAGEVISRVAFANKTVSLTKSCVKAFIKSKSTLNASYFGDDDDVAASMNPSQIGLIRAKTHTWTKVVSQSKTEVVIDVITCTKARVYVKSVQKGFAVTFTGTGQVSWEKSKVTIVAKRAHNMSSHEHGLHFIKKQLESTSILQFLGNPFEMAM